MLTILVATRNRATLLPRVLSSFAALRAPAGGWRLVVIDNASGDDTQAVLASFASQLPMTILSCDRPGMNAALNRGAAAVTGDLVVKADDDVLPNPDWLIAYRAAADAHRTVDLFGGTVTPEFEVPPPAWLTDRAAPFSVLYAACAHPAGPCAVTDIYGPNWAIRARHLAGPDPFDTAFGPDHTRPDYAMGGETSFFLRLARQGVAGRFVPDAAVRHLVRAEQMTEAWVRARAFRYGLGSGAWMPPDCARGRSRLAGLPAPLVVRLLAYAAADRASRVLPPSPRRLALGYRAHYLAGVAAALRKRSPLP